MRIFDRVGFTNVGPGSLYNVGALSLLELHVLPFSDT